MTLEIGNNSLVWAFNLDTVKSAINWSTITIRDPAVAAGYTHGDGPFPSSSTKISAITTGTDSWVWQYSGNSGSRRQYQPQIEIFSVGNETPTIDFGDFYNGNWAHILPNLHAGPVRPVPTEPTATSTDSYRDGNTDDSFRVLFETNGGTTISPIIDLSYGDVISKPTDPVRDGYIFGGWYTDEACTKEWDFTRGIPGGMTLYSKWIGTAPTVTSTVPTPKVTIIEQPTTGPTVPSVSPVSTDISQPDDPKGVTSPSETSGNIHLTLLGIGILVLLILFFLLFLLRHTVTLLVPTGSDIEEYRSKSGMVDILIRMTFQNFSGLLHGTLTKSGMFCGIFGKTG